MKIDLVYLWVDGSDPVWQAKKRSLSEPGVAVSQNNVDDDCEGRYADNDELKFSLRSANQYAPWINKIFIVTDNQVPKWLDVSHPKIRVVDHSEILPREILPTFNSVTIEHGLWRIPGLSEHFLYANDDMFFNREVSPSDFFTERGLPIVRFNRRPLRKLSLWFKEKIQGKELSTYNRTIQNSANLVKQSFGKYIGHKTHHNIDAYSLSSYSDTYDIFKKDIEPTLGRVRSADDVQRNIYSYAAVMKGEAVKVFVNQKTSLRLHIDNPTHLHKLESVTPMLFCVNDSKYATEADRARVRKYLSERFPTPAPWEKVSPEGR